ncbi:sugar phosphate isomerase/epimerase family protein [Paenibacillus cymbidii]|uniref:sugar phosphate isomerase/epimerase family protein n=1 Tax=Paenibacillus cymbidii TaxID=1639034 RepID=UPI001082303B|nr:TIM barrel protein [Paenibacillus cymbidii]
MKLSIGGYSFNKTVLAGKMDIFGYLETVKYRYRLDTVDLWNGTFTERREGLWAPPEESYLRLIREALDEKEMTVVNYAVDGAHLWDPDPDKREALARNARAHLRAAELLGARTVRIDTGTDGTMEMGEEQFDYTVRLYREYAERADGHGYRVGPENHMGPSLVPASMKRIAEAVEHPGYGILLHLDRWKQDAAIGDRLVAPWVCHTHFDGRTSAPGAAEPLVRMLLDAGYDGYWGIEYNAEGNQYAEVEWALASVRSALSRVYGEINGASRPLQ